MGENLAVFKLLASSVSSGDSINGLISATRRLIKTPNGRNPSPVLLTPLVSLLRRSESRPSSLTLPCVSASVCSSVKTTRESPPTSPVMVACLSLTRTTRSSLLDSEDQAMLSVIFPVSVLRSSRLPVRVSSHSGSARRTSHRREQLEVLHYQLSFR